MAKSAVQVSQRRSAVLSAAITIGSMRRPVLSPLPDVGERSALHNAAGTWVGRIGEESATAEPDRQERKRRVMTPPDNLQIGINARLFPSNWRPVLNEIDFAAAHGFAAIQFPGKEEGLASHHLGAEIPVVRDALQQAGIVAVMEIMIRVDAQGYTTSGRTPIEILTANLPAITGLNCQCVHIHFTPAETVAAAMLPGLEERLLPSLAAGARLGQEWGFHFGFEHNEPAIGLFASPQSCASALMAIAHLAFVWDMNHTHPHDLQPFTGILPRVSMVHVSDTRLPEVNEHLPLGLGTIDFPRYCHLLRTHGFRGPAILEIGGLPKSGGYNRDTDAALVESLGRLRLAHAAAASYSHSSA